jgi:O-antigen ligase
LLLIRGWVLRTGAFALPLVYAPVLYDAYVLPKLLLARVLVLVLLGIEVARWALSGRIRVRRSALDLPLLAFVGSAALSSLVAVNRSVAIFGTYTRYEGFLTIATYALLFWLARQAITNRREARALARSLIASGCVVAVLAILQSVIATATAGGHLGETALSFAGLIRPTSTLGNANELGILLAMLLPLSLYEILAARSWFGRLMGINATVVLGLALVLTFSRSAWIAAVAGILVVLASRVGRRPRVLATVGIAGLVAVVVIAAGIAGTPILHAVVARLASLISPGTGSAGTRLDIWGDTLRLVAARPIAGWGPDSFGLVFPRYASGNWTPGIPIDEAHAQALQVAATQGILGVAAYLWLLVALFVAFWRGRGLEGAVAMFGGMLAYQLAIQVNFSWVPAALPFWLLAAAAVATWETPAPDAARDSATRAVGPRRRTVAVLACAIGVGLGAATTIRPLSGDAAFFEALAAQQRGDLPAARSAIRTAELDSPEMSVYAVRAGDLALDLTPRDTPGPDADWEAAITAYSTAADLGTDQPAAFRHLAVAEWALGRRQAAIQAARVATSLGPFDSTNAALLSTYLSEDAG